MAATHGWPDENAVRHFRADGWVVSPVVLPHDLLDACEEAVQAYYVGERDRRLPIAGGFLDWHSEHGGGLRLNDYVSLQSDVLHTLVTWPELGRMASVLAGVRGVRLFHDQLVTKPVGRAVDTTVGWHVDIAYWRTCARADHMLTAWIPFRDCPADDGPIAVIPGSHRWEGTEWMGTFLEQRPGVVEARLGRTIDPRQLALVRGQISFHHARTIHGSLPNLGKRARTALAVHMQDLDNRYTPHMDGVGQPAVHLNDVLCRRSADGVPDYTDPSICPVLWAQGDDDVRRT